MLAHPVAKVISPPNVKMFVSKDQPSFFSPFFLRSAHLFFMEPASIHWLWSA